ncbi:MAG TPA: PLP-dependent aminotransferase family protein [Chloroflexota bacterium]|nr:PLP-dependent aminotransferase family protein [Chloroflexota bacterium]
MNRSSSSSAPPQPSPPPALAGGAAGETIALTRGVPAPEVLPGADLAACFAAAVERDPTGVLQYGQPAGYLPLRRLLAGQYGVDESQVFVTNGSLQLMDLLAGHLLTPGASVIVERPSYDRAIGAYRRRGARVVGVALQEDGIDLQALEAELRRQVPAFLYLIPDFQNPAGITLSLDKRRRLLDLAARHEFWVVEDVPYRLLRYQGTALPTLREIDHPGAARVLTMSSHSKLVAPALRVGHLVAPAPLVAALARLGEDTYLSPVLPTQAVLHEYLRQGRLEPNVAHLKATYAPRCQAMIDAVRRHLPGVPFAPPEGGFFLGLTLPEGARTDGLLERAQASGLLLSDGRAFFAPRPASAAGADAPDGAPSDREAERFIRLPFCALTPEQIEEGVRRLGALVA